MMPETPPAQHPLRWLWLAGALIGVLAAGAASTILNPALPVLVRDLALPIGSELRWIIGATALAFAVLVVPAAVIGDLVGHVRLHLLGALCFTLASVLGAVASSGGALVVARLGQGAGAALMVPQVIGYARAHLPRVERAIACALFGLAFVAGPALGPLLGSLLVEHVTWRSTFWVMVPAGVLAAATAVALLRQRVGIRFDPLALVVALLALPATFGIMYPLTIRALSDWPAWYALPLILGCVLFAGCLAVEVIRRGIRAGLGAPLVALLVVAGAAHFSTLQSYVQYATGQPVHTIALVGLPFAAGALVGAGLATVLALWGDVRIGTALGAAFIGAGAVLPLVVLTFTPDSMGVAVLAVGAGINGVGLALVLATLVRTDATAGRQRAESVPTVLFAALPLGTAAGGAMAQLLARSFVNRAVPGDARFRTLELLRDAVSPLLVGSIVLLAVAVLVALLLGPRGGRTTA